MEFARKDRARPDTIIRDQICWGGVGRSPISSKIIASGCSR